MEEADALGQVIGIMSHGQIVALGTSVHLSRRFDASFPLHLYMPMPTPIVYVCTCICANTTAERLLCHCRCT